jgi:ketosteroid isomerase-like protein
MARAGVKVAVETTFHRPHEVCILQTVTVAATAPVQVPPTDNVGIVRSVYEAWARGDIAAVLALVDEGATWTVPETVAFGGTYLGPGKVGIFFAKLHESYREVRAEPLSYVGAGDTVSVVGRYRGVARSGTAVEVPFVHIWTMAKGRATSFTETLDTAKVNTALATPAPSIDLTTPAPTRVST